MPYTELYHHGINGQRWGFRRFQNEDGSLTPEGELRYNQGKQKLARGKAAEMYKTKKFKADLKRKEEQRKIKDAAKVAKTAKKEQAKLNAEDRVIRKKPKNMTDEELRNEVNRLAMELDYQKKSWQVERGKKGPGVVDKMDEFFERPTGRIVANLGSNIIQQVATNSLNKIIEEKTLASKRTELANKKQQLENNKKIGKNWDIANEAAQEKLRQDKKTFEADFNEKYGKKETSDTQPKTSTTAKSKMGQTWKVVKNDSSKTQTQQSKPKSASQSTWDSFDWSKSSGNNIISNTEKSKKVSSLDSTSTQYWAKVTSNAVPADYFNIVVNGNKNNTNTPSSNYWAKTTGVKHFDEDDDKYTADVIEQDLLSIVLDEEIIKNLRSDIYV